MSLLGVLSPERLYETGSYILARTRTTWLSFPFRPIKHQNATCCFFCMLVYSDFISIFEKYLFASNKMIFQQALKSSGCSLVLTCEICMRPEDDALPSVPTQSIACLLYCIGEQHCHFQLQNSPVSSYCKIQYLSEKKMERHLYH